MRLLRDMRFAHVVAITLPVVLASLLAAPASGQSARQPSSPVPGQQTYASPDEALSALKTAVSAADKQALRGIFGPAVDEMTSGDEVADKNAFGLFAKRLAKMTNLVKQDDSKVVLYVGAENWPFQFPIVQAGGRWFFDGEAGLDEMFNRRIGANELMTIRVCRVYASAQKEYAEADRDGDEVLEYAQKVASSPGAKDGLYWESADDGDESPLGPLVAVAATEGYAVKQEPQPFHGYRYRILKRQGRNAPGGAYGYVVNGNMIGGFALVAYPAEWGSSGLMTFVVNQQGKVYQKDLGPRTAAIAAGMRAYDPDKTWTLVDDN